MVKHLIKRFSAEVPMKKHVQIFEKLNLWKEHCLESSINPKIRDVYEKYLYPSVNARIALNDN